MKTRKLSQIIKELKSLKSEFGDLPIVTSIDDEGNDYIDVLTDEEEHGLLEYMFPHVDVVDLKNVASIAHMTRVEANNETARISSGISTRTSVEMSGLLYDGFNLQEAANVCVYPQYDNTGGVDSERTFVKQIVQKFIDDGSNDELFSEDEVEEATAV